MIQYRDLFLKLKNPGIVGIAGLTVIALGCVLLMIPLRLTSLSNTSKIAKLQSEEAGAMLSLKINSSADRVRNYSYLVAHLAATDLIPNEYKREFLLSQMEMRYQNIKSLSNLWSTFEPNALDGMDAHFINRVGSNELGIFAPWFADNKLTVSSEDDYVSEFYAVPKATKQEVFSDPYWDIVHDEHKLMISFSAPLMHNDTFLGVVGTDFYLDELNELLATIPNLVGSGKLVTDKGIIVIHDNPELIGTPDNCEHHETIMDNLVEGKMLANFYKSEEGDIYKACVPVQLGSSNKPWVYVVEVPARQIYSDARRTVVLLAIIFVLLFASIYFYVKIIEKNRELKRLHTVKDKLFSVVAHDLRGPIGSMTSLLKLTSTKKMDTETQTQMLKEISKRVDDVYGLLDNLLRWAKNQMKGMVLSPVFFDVQNETRAVTNSLREIAAGKMIALNNRTEQQMVYADRDLFSVVVRNLTTNALKYTSKGGEIIINSELSGNMLVISVKDTGTGMPQDVQDKLFKLSETKSQRGTDNEKGTGLGLVLCADFVKVIGGNIWFTSKEGEGSTFFFSVPLKNDKAPAPNEIN